jgi:hypothetical protein
MLTASTEIGSGSNRVLHFGMKLWPLESRCDRIMPANGHGPKWGTDRNRTNEVTVHGTSSGA